MSKYNQPMKRKPAEPLALINVSGSKSVPVGTKVWPVCSLTKDLTTKSWLLVSVKLTQEVSPKWAAHIPDTPVFSTWKVPGVARAAIVCLEKPVKRGNHWVVGFLADFGIPGHGDG